MRVLRGLRGLRVLVLQVLALLVVVLQLLVRRRLRADAGAISRHFRRIVSNYGILRRAQSSRGRTSSPSCFLRRQRTLS